MLSLPVFVPSILICCFLSLLFPWSTRQLYYHFSDSGKRPIDNSNNNMITIRPADADDLDAMTSIGLAAFPMDPQWPYRFPSAQAFPDDHYKYSRIRLSEYLDNTVSGACTVMLAEAPSNEDPAVRKVVAMSMWQMPGTHLKEREGALKGGDRRCAYRRRFY